MYKPEWLNRLHFAFSRRSNGQMSFKRADTAIVRSNRVSFLNEHGLDIDRIVAPELIHGAKVTEVRTEDVGSGSSEKNWIMGADGLVTTDNDVLLLTTHADCAALIIYDPKNQVLGQAHAGWRGLAEGIVPNLVKLIRSKNGKRPSKLYAWIGPTVRACCYPVGPDIAARFPQECSILVGNSLRLDLVRFIRLELELLGLDYRNVSDAGVCTSCSSEFSSYRRDGSKTCAMACVTGLKH